MTKGSAAGGSTVPGHRQPWRRHAAVAARTLLAAAIIAALLWYDVIDVGALVSVLADPVRALPALAMLAAAFLLGSLRWYLILRAAHLQLRFRSVFEIYAIGAFFNTFLPGGTGGDIVRILYVFRGVRAGRLRAAVTVLADRVVGLYGMLMLSMAVIYLNSDRVFGYAATAALGAGLMLLFAAITIAGAATFLAAPRILAMPAVQTWPERGRLRRLLHRAIEMLALFRGAMGILAVSIAVSAALSLLLVTSIVALALDRGWGSLTILDYACAAVLALLASAIPITPGGIGVAEGAFAYVCQLWAEGGIAPYGTIFLGYRLIAAAISFVGAFAFLTHRRPSTYGPDA